MNDQPAGSVRVKELKWDSQQFGMTCGLIDLSLHPGLSPAAAFQRLVAVLKEREDITFVTIKLASNLAAMLSELAIEGLRFVDTELIFRFKPDRVTGKAGDIRFVQTTDPEPFLPLAKEMRWSRFVLDSRLPKSKSIGLWENSIHNHCSGKARYLAIAYENQCPAGLVVVCHQSDHPPELNFFLVGVLPEFQRRGIGRKLISAATHKFGNQYAIQVETSVQNRTALRLYQGCEFEVQDIRYILHLIR